jgi:two-component system OmpR family response regulator
MTAVPRVLVVEDEDAIRSLLVAALRREPFDVDAAPDGVAALQLTAGHEYAVIILDLMMPRLNGFDFLDAFHRTTLRPRSVVFVLTAFDDAMIGRLSPERVHAIIRKPFDVPQLVAMVREVVITWAAHATPVSLELPADADVAPFDIPAPHPEPAN